MLPEQSPLIPQHVPKSTVVVLKRDLTDWSLMLGQLELQYTLARFSNTDRCLRYIADKAVALVILDADLSNRELFRAIRSRHHSIPILCVTGSSYPTDLVEARAREYQFHTFSPG
ncbi:MAG: hypothetical protein WBN60_15250, partial [Polyangiales bacterium]